MDLAQIVASNPWLSGGVFGLWVGTIIWVVTGFTNRGWTTRKQRAEINEGRDKLDVERARTIEKQDTLIAKQGDTILSQATTISGIDQFFGKLPVKKAPKTGDTPSTEPQAVT